MRERMFYFSKIASHHNFDRSQAREDWERATILEKALKRAENIQSIHLKKKENNQN